MTLADVTLPIDVEWGRQHALVFSPALAARLAELHALHGVPDCRAWPVPLTGGRLMLAADILRAAEPGGYLHAMWEAADKSVLLPAVEVLPMSEVAGLVAVPTEGE